MTSSNAKVSNVSIQQVDQKFVETFLLMKPDLNHDPTCARTKQGVKRTADVNLLVSTASFSENFRE